MPFYLSQTDITKMQTDAIVNAANTHLLEGGGVCGAIFRAAGAASLRKECDALSPCETGNAVITKGYGLSAKYIIHAVGPIWRGGNEGEEGKLYSAYYNALRLARDNGCRSLAFPLISAGIYGYPAEAAFCVAKRAIREFLEQEDTEGIEGIQGIQVKGEMDKIEEMKVYLILLDKQKIFTNAWFAAGYPAARGMVRESCSYNVTALETLINNRGETFTQTLLRLIDEKGYSDVEVYKRANIDRKLFSKIRSNKEYNPKKQTALALAVGLKLTVEETGELLKKAGYSLSEASKSDVIIQYFLENGEFDIYSINEALFYYEQPLLGA